MLSYFQLDFFSSLQVYSNSFVSTGYYPFWILFIFKKLQLAASKGVELEREILGAEYSFIIDKIGRLQGEVSNFQYPCGPSFVEIFPRPIQVLKENGLALMLKCTCFLFTVNYTFPTPHLWAHVQYFVGFESLFISKCCLLKSGMY